MAESVRTPMYAHAAREAAGDREHTDTAADVDVSHLLASHTGNTRPREVPGTALTGAVASWFVLVFGICYLALPAMASVAGLYSGMLPNLIVNTLAFVPLAILTVGLVSMIRPRVVTSPRAPRDPVIAATLGSLGMWFVGQEISPVLQSVLAMPLVEGITFTALNVVESGLFGMMLASFTRSPVRAFALGAAFQAMFLFFFTGWL